MDKFLIHYKLSFEKNYKPLALNKETLTLSELKSLLFESIFKPVTKKSLSNDFDLEVTNADTKQIIENETDLIYKNSRLILKRNVILDPSSKQKPITNKDSESEQLDFILRQSMKSMKMCKLCKQSGHESKECNARGTILRPPAGLPKSHYIIVGPNQKITTRVELMAKKCLTKADNFIFDQDENIKTKVLNESTNYIPEEFKCSFGQHIMQEAVFVPCGCGRFYCCNWCLLNKITNGDSIQCVHSDCNNEINFDNIISCYNLRNKIKFYLNNKNNKLIIDNKNETSNFFFNRQIVKKINETNLNQSYNYYDKFLGIKRKSGIEINQNKRTKIE